MRRTGRARVHEVMREQRVAVAPIATREGCTNLIATPHLIDECEQGEVTSLHQKV